MKDKILQEALEWYESQGENPNIEDFVDLVIGKTTDIIFTNMSVIIRNLFVQDSYNMLLFSG